MPVLGDALQPDVVCEFWDPTARLRSNSRQLSADPSTQRSWLTACQATGFHLNDEVGLREGFIPSLDEVFRETPEQAEALRGTLVGAADLWQTEHPLVQPLDLNMM